ncbi:phosphatase PAP2 family protein [Salinicola corii]|uniref:undecaprenyl-diphosphate phosphatase n=1 Tax=Salinicola corii TaxID=2606937 RepID=A0A640W887_9GAMM|nr:phosphatase PAP2 family protein [Salinicola corii]KAA0015302.1 phosphatase PAP2 family protein [Salinicola corii]
MSIDSNLTSLINGLSGRSSLLDWLMIAITHLGLPLMALCVVPLWWFRVNRSEMRYLAISAALTLTSGLLINQLVLLFISRARPYTEGLTHLLIAPSMDPSFPSDHATGAVAIAVTFFFHGRIKMGALFFLAALLVMFSRVYVGTHYVTDVLGGLVTASMAGLFVSRFHYRESLLNRCLTRICSGQCSGSLKPDTHLGGIVATKVEVIHGQKTSFILHRVQAGSRRAHT